MYLKSAVDRIRFINKAMPLQARGFNHNHSVKYLFSLTCKQQAGDSGDNKPDDKTPHRALPSGSRRASSFATVVPAVEL
jgi:hypothetical protein